MTATPTTNTKAFSADMTCPPGERCFVAKMTSDAVDRDNEVLLPEGMDATDFEANPVVFYGHDYDKPPIGKVVSLRREKNHWLAKVQIAERPEDHEGEWFPDTVFSLIKQRVIRGVSVGFQASASPRVPTKADREKFGESVAAVIPRWKLLELSVAPLPANQTALIEAVSKGIRAGEINRSVASRVLDVSEQELERVVLSVPRPSAPTRKRVTLYVPDVAAARKAAAGQEQIRRAALTKRIEAATLKEWGRQRGLIYV